MVAQEEWSPPRASLRQQNPTYRSAHRKAAAVPLRGLVVLRLTYEDVMTGREPVLALIAAALDGVAHSSSVP